MQRPISGLLLVAMLIGSGVAHDAAPNGSANVGRTDLSP
jgi:hypothetical protein